MIKPQILQVTNQTALPRPLTTLNHSRPVLKHKNETKNNEQYVKETNGLRN